MTTPELLVIAGHDNGGRAGISADREAAQAAGVGLQTVVTAWTEQSDRGVSELGARPAAEWLAEALAFLEDEPAALKFGLLPGLEALEAARALLRHLRSVDESRPWVLDPVLAASSGTVFLGPAEIDFLRGELMPLGPILTPNRPELAQLSGLSENDSPIEGAHRLLEFGCRAVVVKGGHSDEDPVRDLVLEAGQPASWVELPRLPGAGIRGSGCRHATFLAALLAQGADLLEAARGAALYVAERIAAASDPDPRD